MLTGGRMKIRADFVTNSSSTSYIIQMNGSTDGDRSAKAFIEDFLDVLLEWFPRYQYTGLWLPETRDFTQQEMEYAAKEAIAKNASVYHDMSIHEFFLFSTEDKIEFLTEVLENYYRWPKKTRSGFKFSLFLGDSDRTILGQLGDYMLRSSPSSSRFNVMMPVQVR